MLTSNNAKQVMRNAINYLHIPTYDDSNQAVHPSVLYFENEWNEWKYWMAMTPYPFGNSQYEDPSILVSNDGKIWKVPEGLKNPLITPPVHGYNADPDIVYNSETDELWIYFLRYWSDKKIVKMAMIKSNNGITWSKPDYLIEWNLNECDNGRSYTIVKQDSLWHLWYQRGKDVPCVEYRRSSNGIKWSEPIKVNIVQKGYKIWHLDIIYVVEKEEYWMLYCAYPEKDNASNTTLFFAKSKDGLNWITYHKPVLEKGNKWDNAQIYKATGIYDQKKIKIWYSARGVLNNRILRGLLKIPLIRRYINKYSNLWHIGYTEENYDVFMQELEK